MTLTPLRAYALSITPRQTPPPVTTPAAVAACRECGGRTYKGRLLCIKCEKRPRSTREERSEGARKAARVRWDGKPKEPVTGHRAGDHSACELDYRHGVCSECGKTVAVGRSSAPPDRRRCRECQRTRPRRSPKKPLAARVCELCDESYVPKWRPRPGQQQRFCSKSCTTAWQNGARPPYQRNAVTGMPRKVQLSRIRSQRKAQTWDGVTDAEIMERDRWRCGICKKAIGKSFRYPDGRSRSIDHVVPLSEGGDDTAANKRAAHLGCNRRRMNRGGNEQLALVG